LLGDGPGQLDGCRCFDAQRRPFLLGMS
jgi:hypothetical protein